MQLPPHFTASPQFPEQWAELENANAPYDPLTVDDDLESHSNHHPIDSLVFQIHFVTVRSIEHS
jgi:hypothetical protein